jgi:hypothetical protein
MGAACNTGTIIAISDVQLEIGSVPTPFEHIDIGTELAMCQRFYQLPNMNGKQGYVHAATQVALSGSLPVTMRGIPVMTLVNASAFSALYSAYNSAGWMAQVATITTPTLSAGPDGFFAIIAGWTGLTVNTPVICNGASSCFGLSCEL